MISQPLLDYVSEQAQKGVPGGTIRQTLLSNDWSNEEISEAFSRVGVLETGEVPEQEESDAVTLTMADTFASETAMNKIIEKIIPIIGAIFLIVGLGYLIYANAWVYLPMQIRIGLGFFASLVIIGSSFSLSKKMSYFTDIGIGSGVLLMYGTLIYGSRATELAEAVIPEIATLITAVIFTLAVAYFASKRNSKVILMLGMIGAYITPFVIGQNDVWVQNVSFNAYLLYFLAINIAVFLMGREISVRDIIPLNIIGLFVGVSTLWGLASSQSINVIQSSNIFTSELVTAILFVVLVLFTMWSVLISAKRFKESDDGYLSIGYIAPVAWFAFNIAGLDSLTNVETGLLYTIIAASSFVGWHVLRREKTRFQHAALYAAGLITLTIAFFSFFEDMNVVTSMFISYASLVFATLYILDPEKTERFVSYMAISIMGSYLSIFHILDANMAYETVLIVTALIPAMAAYPIARTGKREDFYNGARMYSILSGLVAAFFVLREILDYVDLDFLFFYLVPLAILGYIAYVHKFAYGSMSHDAKSKWMRITLVWFAFGFIGIFLTLVNSVYPAPTDTYLFTHLERPTDWVLVKGIFATIILFLGLYISRQLQKEQAVKRPSFILVIFGFATLVLTGNYIISAVANDLAISLAQGGPRAVATTIWWVAVSIYMLYVGIRLGKKYHAEKLLGLLLMGLSVGKIVLYDIATMGMQNKIIVLMLIGGAMLLFSYVIRSKDLISESSAEKE